MSFRPSSSEPIAVIIAAGVGSRLQEHAGGRPKGLLEIGGRPLIEHSIAALKAAGLREIVLVTGWQAEDYRRWCEAFDREILIATNPDYLTTGSLHSLLVGAARVPARDILLAESDLLFEHRAAARLFAAHSPDTVLISGFTQNDDEVWAYANKQGRLRELTKVRQPGGPPLGELVGLSRLSATLVAEISQAAEGLPRTAHYEDGLNAVAEAHPIELLCIPDLAWCEIDHRAHLERARATIWPRIVANNTAQTRY